jgi:hypothetical protein
MRLVAELVTTEHPRGLASVECLPVLNVQFFRVSDSAAHDK